MTDQFDWLLGYEAFDSFLKESIIKKGLQFGHIRALVLGCGTSQLSYNLIQNGICSHVISVDIEEDCISFMKDFYKHESRLEWEVMDITNISSIDSILKNKQFDLIIDKATLDAILCEENAHVYFYLVFNYLNCQTGLYFFVSLYGVNFLERLFNFDLLIQPNCFCVTTDKICKNSESIQRAYLTMYHRNCGDSCQMTIVPSMDAIEQHFQTILDWYMKEKAPFMTETKLLQIKAIFGQHKKKIPLEEAYKTIFDAELSADFTLDDFVDDITSYFETIQLQNECTYDQLVTYLKENQ